MKKSELLIPVGNQECLLAAIHNGADAVYLGGKKFGARAYSNNFDEEEMIKAIKLCHLYNVKIYVTVNTMIYNDEIKEVMDYLKFLYINNVDAVIMQDIGLINLTRKLLPNLEIHVSTQAHNHNEEGIKYFKDLGCTRVVFDRESSLETIKSFKTDLEKEIFVYGALCVCYSGNCLFSALNGTRSANRGMCVGSCRLPYKLIKNNKKEDEGFLLSTKDLNTIPNLNKILDANIDSLKIEGRMKSKEYVAVVTKTFRRLIDDYYAKKELKLSKKEEQDLLKTYNREFTPGYLFNSNNIINKKTSNHQGIPIGKIIDATNKKITIKLNENIHQEDAIRIESINKGFYLNTLYNEKGLLVSNVEKNNICLVDNKEQLNPKEIINSNVLKTIDYELNKELNNPELKKIEINMSFTAQLDKPIKLTISEGKFSIDVYGPLATKAEKRSITKENIQDQLSKLGNTPFKINKLSIKIANNLFINLKDLNEIRRTAISELKQLKEGSPKRDFTLDIPKIEKNTSYKPQISVLVRNEEQLQGALNKKVDFIYTPNLEIYKKYKDLNNLYLRTSRVEEKLKRIHNENLLCTELGSINKNHQDNNIRSDYYLNVANDYTIEALRNLDVNSITLSVENDLNHLLEYKNKSMAEVIVYGTPECMIIKNNIFNLKKEKAYLEDHKNNRYLLEYDNFTHIFNNEPINLIKEVNKLKDFGTLRIELLEESKIETERIITKIKDML